MQLISHNGVIEIRDGQLLIGRCWPNWLADGEADNLYRHCLSGDWQQPSVKVFGRWHPIPRQQRWLGEVGCDYRYSGLLMSPETLDSQLSALMRKVSTTAEHRYNSVLMNRYRNGDDSMGWHSDSEPELGIAPQVAILSLGQARPLQLRDKRDHQRKLELELPSGSLLQLLPSAQSGYHHQLPKRKRIQGERISLTFRHIIPNYWRD
ncbi:alpha-ketoglutarate-dependent dioxygenase AlkB family protein [Ferrimonas aestuarii]|uniref:Alpha-ketoglutarate-dependent dioxygenase AlkB n=1 Tax=Ferrimonas aestuarii TaxID=2569539 RepID=A0A4V5NW32_9GAMM|nr:alpha-ketoglutarate-dependent dioxygenase AlkB [Ferrimonas aestuarii]TKB54659.1 alpha-ketoglutarate-dependent dioxygenase AlkB [Ferrimonas aestuarii]